MLVGEFDLHTDQRHQDSLGLYIVNPLLEIMSGPHLAAPTIPASSDLVTPVTPHPETSLQEAITSLRAEFTDARLRVRFMEQNRVPKQGLGSA
ncbi:hypothetical protein FS837_010162 [Tulasnella sp. UAMH 9824]|nr:hypothetical protein FS837_010162 [Tulasnella sp. UAMH 9824]